MKGLYFYKLVSPYKEDVTKDCKLSINEIDSNFITLKDADIKDISFDENRSVITLTRNDGEVYEADLSSLSEGVVHNLSVDYCRKEGKITISHDGETTIIDGLLTKGSHDVLTEVCTDSTLVGKGICNSPLGLKVTEQTGQVKPCIKFVNMLEGEQLPKVDKVKKGERYLTLEKVSDYGYLYDYKAVKNIIRDLPCCWRVPTKADWDDMLNAIEPCDKYRNHDSLVCNKVLGKVAGKLLKTRNRWIEDLMPSKKETFCGHEEFDLDFHEERHPKEKEISPKGVDAYGMRILASGYGDEFRTLDYFGKRCGFWTSTMIDNTDVYVKRFDYDRSGVAQVAEDPHSLFNIRLMKDYDGSNFNEVECIEGQVYRCVLMPSLTADSHYTIWMTSNLAINKLEYNPKSVEDKHHQHGDIFRSAYFTVEWDGKEWVRKEFKEGDSVVLFEDIEKHEPHCDSDLEHVHGCPNAHKEHHHQEREPKYDYNEYRLIKGELVSVTEKMETEIMHYVKREISILQGTIDNEILAREEADEKLQEAIDAETAAREDVDNQLWNAIAEEASARTQVDNELWSGLTKEAAAREDVDNQLWAAIAEETSARTQVDNEQWAAIAEEASARTQVDDQLWKAIAEEAAARIDVDNQQWSAITQCFENLEQETKDRITVDNQQWERINYNTEHLVVNGEYESVSGTLTLETQNPDNNITIQFNGNYGTF